MIKWLRSLLKGPEPEKPKTVIWGIIDGPYVREDFPEEELWGNGVHPECQAMLVCKIEENGEVFTANYWFPSLEEAREVKGYFDTNIQPLEVDLSKVVEF